MIEGLDFATGAADPGALKAAGAGFVCRYLSTPGNPKNLTLAEAATIRKAGLGIVLVFETTANRALAGAAAGKKDAASARAQAAACGAPASVPIYLAVDFDPAPSDIPKIRSYFKGAASVLGVGKTGVYGGFAAVKACLDAKVCKYGWQTYAWSGGRWDARAELEQYRNAVAVAGITADRDRAVAKSGDFGQWPPVRGKKPATPPTPAPAPVSVPVTVTGPKGGVIARRPLTAVRKLLPGLLRRFKNISIRQGR